jgi:hypothetical protein
MGHFKLINKKDMRSNTQKKTENISSKGKAEIPYDISFPVITTVLDVLRRNALRPSLLSTLAWSSQQDKAKHLRVRVEYIGAVVELTSSYDI